MNTGLKMKMSDKIREALDEDITYKDISVEGIFKPEDMAYVDIISKENGIICGLHVFSEVFNILDPDIEINFNVTEGQRIKKGDFIGSLRGKAQAILLGERTALNFLQRMSGVASMTRLMVDKLNDESINIVDTRKTIPGLRIFDKYSVEIGGGKNHRYNLSDMVMLKDNHINAIGSIEEAVKIVREKISFTQKVEVEVENLDDLDKALRTDCDIIMLDNMSIDMIREAVKLIDRKVIIELSGNINLDNIDEYRGLGIDIISSGSLTNSVKAFDISMKNMTLV